MTTAEKYRGLRGEAPEPLAPIPTKQNQQSRSSATENSLLRNMEKQHLCSYPLNFLTSHHKSKGNCELQCAFYIYIINVFQQERPLKCKEKIRLVSHQKGVLFREKK